MPEILITAKVTEFPLDGIPLYDESVIVPTVKGNLFLKYGKHAYYFYNFKRSKCLCVELSHAHVIAPGLPLFFRALGATSLWAKVRLIFQRFHYGFGFLEQIMLMTVPHAVTVLGKGEFLINLWSYVGFMRINCKARSVEYLRGSQGSDEVLGSQQCLDSRTGELYSMSYSLPESFRKIADPHLPVASRILKQCPESKMTEVWRGSLTDYLHDILISRTGRYCVVCELGMFQDEKDSTIPSKVLVVDLQSRRHWIISKFIVAAHAQFDPAEEDVIYFSHHNFKFVPSSILRLLRDAIYALKFTGPAAVYKYKLTSEGPQELGVFTDPKMFRLTNFHVFTHRGKKLLAAMGFPNLIFLADAETMTFLRKIAIQNPASYKYFFRKVPCFIGTFSPSLDGERLYVQTTRSFQVIDVESGAPISSTPLYFNHTAANHMQTASDTAW